MEAALRRAKEQGVELVCFGDIDIENNRAWGEERCRNVGLEAVYPLWHHDRQENVREVLELGYRCLIKTLDRRVLPRHLLGRVMDRAMVEEMTACGVDICGENGEFHTIAVDGVPPAYPLLRPAAAGSGGLLRGGYHGAGKGITGKFMDENRF